MATRKKAPAVLPVAGVAIVDDKAALIARLRSELEGALDVMRAAARAAADAASDPENKPENDKDTRALEAGYIAGAQATRAGEMHRTLLALSALSPRAFADDERIAATALVELLDVNSDARSTIFLCPIGGGMKTRLGSVDVSVVTPQSPLGDAVMGRKRGDVVEARLGPSMRELEILSVR